MKLDGADRRQPVIAKLLDELADAQFKELERRFHILNEATTRVEKRVARALHLLRTDAPRVDIIDALVVDR